MTSRFVYPVLAVVGIAAASGAAWWYQHRTFADSQARATTVPAAQVASRAVTVEAAEVALMTLRDDAQTVGSLRSRQGVMLRPEVSGRVSELNFRDGQRVRRGQLLVQLDDRLPRAQLKQSEAELSIAEANHKRNQELLAQNFISQRSVDESAANLEVAQARLALAQATLARLRIVAPFDGIAGIRNVNVGDYLKDGTDIVNLEDIDTLYVDYRLPERYQTKVRRGQEVMVELDALPGQRFTAKVEAVDPLIDADGRSIGVRASIDNRRLQLRPGMFARVTTVFGVREQARVVPEEAIVPQGGRQFVIRLVPGDAGRGLRSQQVEVRVGIRRPGQVEILEGLQAGDRVVIAGQHRLQRDGSPVQVLDVAAAR